MSYSLTYHKWHYLSFFSIVINFSVKRNLKNETILTPIQVYSLSRCGSHDLKGCGSEHIAFAFKKQIMSHFFFPSTIAA